jgi:hypothetical protein
MTDQWILNQVLHTLSKSRYKDAVKSLLAAHSAAGTFVSSLDEVIRVLNASDIF